ncbi:MAG: alpha/beta fold hydrolase [Bacteroidia bacterium]
MIAHNLSFNGASIAVFTKGNIENNPIVFLHGNSLSSLTYKKQFEMFDLPMVALDLHGHGSSAPAGDPERTYSIPGYGEMLAHVTEELKLKDFILAGHSLGGHVATEALPFLKGAKGLFIFGTPPLASINSLGEAFLPNPLFPLLLQGELSAEEAGSLGMGMVTNKKYGIDLKNEILKTDPAARSFFGASVGRAMMSDEVAILNSLSYKLAIVHGKDDAFINPVYIEGLNFGNLWEGKIHYIEDSGHCPQMEQPHRFNELLGRYHRYIYA